jgi:hypothetical protein
MLVVLLVVLLLLLLLVLPLVLLSCKPCRAVAAWHSEKGLQEATLVLYSRSTPASGTARYSRVNSVPEYTDVKAMSSVMPMPGSHPSRAYAAGNSHKPQPSWLQDSSKIERQQGNRVESLY